MNLPPQVLELTNFFLNAVDSAVPELIQGLYLTGSIALDDFQEGSSDIDFVAVSDHRANDMELQGLAAVHTALRERYPEPNFDGTHLCWSDLDAGPETCSPAPFNFEGKFEPSGRYAIDPITWHELAKHSVALRGPSLVGSSIWCDVVTLRTWTLNNLSKYWRPWLERYRHSPARVDLLNFPVVWGVLGVARLHYTIASGQITSKTGAGRYALRTFGERWARIVSEALRIRSNPTVASDYTNLSERRREVVAFMDMAINTAQDIDSI